jgi:hypothetical protein
MSPTVALILGLLIGWLIEWVIDWVYWRRRTQTILGDAARCQEKLASYEAELKTLRASSGRVPPVEDDRAVRQVPAQAMAAAPITPKGQPSSSPITWK